MTDRAARPAEERPAPRVARPPKPASGPVTREDLELPDGRYLLVYSKPAKPVA